MSEMPCGGDAWMPFSLDYPHLHYPACDTCGHQAPESDSSGAEYSQPEYYGKCPGPDLRLLALAASEVAAERGSFILSIRRGVGSDTR